APSCRASTGPASSCKKASMTTRWNRVLCAAAQVRCTSNELPRLQGKARSVRGPRADDDGGARGPAPPGGMPRLPGGVRVPGQPEAARQAFVRLRHRPARVPREASPAPELTSLRSARLYFITPDRDPDDVVALTSAALRGGADAIQLRHKTLARGRLLDLARRLRDVTAAERALFVVNDFVDIALLSEADGVHLGPDDMTVQSARRVAGDRLLIGASASRMEAAAEAVAQGADYLGSGPAFATPIKAEKGVIGPAAIAA